MRGLGAAALAATFVILLFAGGAQAQPSDQKRAQGHWKKAKIHYNLAEWDEAISELKAGYKLVQNPEFLFNIAQAYRLKGECAEALVFYDTYRRSTTAKDRRTDLDVLVAESRECVDKGGDVEPPVDPIEPPPELPQDDPEPPPVDPVEPPPVSIDPTPHDDVPRRRPWIGASVAGAGVLLGATGLVFHLRSRSAASDIERLGSDGGVFDEDFAALEARGRRDGRIAAGLYIGGAAAIAAGVTLFILDRRSRARSSIALTPTGQGAQVTWSGRF